MEGRFAHVAGAVLTGGGSAPGGPLARRAAELLSSLCEDVLVVGGELPDGAPGRAVGDPPGPDCALRGLVGALEATDRERVLVLAADRPRVEAPLLLALVAWPLRDAVAPRDAGGRHPLCAVYRREPVLETARRRLADGELALTGLLDAIATDWLEGADLETVDPDGRALAPVVP